MSERILWSSFPNLSDDQIVETETPLASGNVVMFTLHTNPSTSSWKELKLFDANNNMLQTIDNTHGPGPVSTMQFSVAQLVGATLLFSKEGFFGIHTGTYDLHDLGTRAGMNVTFDWVADSRGNFLSELVNTVSDVVTTVGNAIGTTVETLLGSVGNAFAAVFNFLESVPGIGRVLGQLINLIQTGANVVVLSGADVLFWVVGAQPAKLMRIMVIVQRDEMGNPVAPLANVLKAVDFAIITFQQNANVRLLPVAPWVYDSPLANTPTSSQQYVVIADENSGSSTLDVNCDTQAWWDDLGTVGSAFENMMIRYAYWGNARRTLGYGAPVCIFAVRSFNPAPSVPGSDVGCSQGPLTNYVTVNFNDTQDPSFSTMAHELGHACNLWHVGDPKDLMIPNEPHAPYLYPWQAFWLRLCRHVTFF